MKPLARRPRIAALAAAATLTLGGLRDASAHFILDAPACYSRQDAVGNPQKSAPCGQDDPRNPAMPTNAITAYARGGMLTLTIREVIPHPGHYRIAIARDMASLPPDPPVTAGSTECGSTVIDRAPTLPVLADGILVHTEAFSAPQTVQIPLPPDFTCERCVLQVVEFMSEHGLNNPGGCFYHHCATVSVGAAPTSDAGPTSDAAPPEDVLVSADALVSEDVGTVDVSEHEHTHDASSPSDASDAAAPDSDAAAPTDHAHAGCGCRVASPAPSRAPFAALGLAFGAVFLRRRARSRR